MKTHSILPNRVVVRRRFTAKLKQEKMYSLTLYLYHPEAFLSDSFVSVSQ